MPQLPADNHTSSQQSRTVLLAADNKNSILAEVAGGKPNSIAYSAYGQQSAQQDVATNIGFNGELRETHFGWYLLGNGYRAYNPTLMRFHSPDNWSPFGGGGLNAYMYCLGDPVNSSDPTGHIRVGKLFSRGYDFLFGGPGATGSGRSFLGSASTATENTSEFAGLMTVGAAVATAPGPRGDIISEGARMTSVASENLSRPGYADGAALAGLTALGNRARSSLGVARPPSSSAGSRSSLRGYSRETWSREGNQIYITSTDRQGNSVRNPRESVVGGGDATGFHTRESTDSRTQNYHRQRMETQRQALTAALHIRSSELRSQGYSVQHTRDIMHEESDRILSRVNRSLRIRDRLNHP